MACVDLVGLSFANALLGLLCGLDGIEHDDVVAVALQEVVEAVPVPTCAKMMC